ncbi:MAG TPA: hypothetical protein VNO52_18270 [Methylomirabilota bacterium]|nr:hypothetical protein [Methylomirabilota bacterium]
MKSTLALCLIAIAGLFFRSSSYGQGSTFTYQGHLTAFGAPAHGLYDFSFSIMDSPTGGASLGGSQIARGLAVSNGLFTVTLNAGAGVFSGAPRWLDIMVRTNGAALFDRLSPRQPITATPYALRATEAGTAGAVAPGAIGSAALQNSAVDSARIADGSIGLPDLSGPLATNTFWRLQGNLGTAPGTHFLGTADNQPLEFRVNNARALRLESTATSPNLVAGFAGNVISNASAGSVIGGGGFGPTNGNRVSGSYNVVAGGYNNEARAGSTTVSGGDNNLASNDRAVIGGGFNNRATGRLSTVAGGDNNTASGLGATVPGGRLNVAGGDYSLAAGLRAKATNQSTFVWADATGGDFGSTANNQFLIRATGGVGIGLNNPAAALDVNGRVKMTEFQLGTTATAGHLLTASASGGGTWQAPPFLLKAGDTLGGDLTIPTPFDLNFGNSTRQMLNLWNASYGIGVQNNTLYQRSDGGFAWFRGGTHNNNANNPGDGGTTLMWLDSSGNLFGRSSLVVDADDANNGSPFPGLVLGNPSGEAIASKRTAGGNQYGIDFYTGFNPRLSIANNGNVGINTTAPGALLDINTGNGSFQVLNDLVPTINLAGGSIPGTMRFRNTLEVFPSFDGTREGKIDVRDTAGNANIILRGNGVATVKVLEINGGADIAEPFQMTGDNIPKGAVVVIDDTHPGFLKLSDRAYDTRVAGIVSGANGITPGLALHQQGRIEGGQNVALTGRVYALADATTGPIKPGDLLTTSATPGHVMKVADRDRGHGAILGKAMSTLTAGRGLVLVLVSLQ